MAILICPGKGNELPALTPLRLVERLAPCSIVIPEPLALAFSSKVILPAVLPLALRMSLDPMVSCPVVSVIEIESFAALILAL